jgi:hypothetical protein
VFEEFSIKIKIEKNAYTTVYFSKGSPLKHSKKNYVKKIPTQDL